MICAGWTGSSTTETIETAPLSPVGREMQAGMTQIMLANLEDSGYSYSPKEVTEYSDPAEASKVQNKYDRITDEIADMEANAPTFRQVPGGGKSREETQYDQSMASKRNQLRQAESDLDNLDSTTYTDYQIEKLPDPRVQNAINIYGEKSPEVAAMEAEIFQQDVFKSEQLAGIERKTLENVTKFVNGDLSYTDEQKGQVDKLYSGVKTAITTLKDDLFSQYGETDTELRAGIGKISEQIDKTGFDVVDALNAAVIQIDKSGASLFSVLEEVNQSTEAKFKFQQDLMFEQIDTQVNQQNAMLGLPPNSEAAQYQKAKMKQDTLTGLQLQLHEQELMGKMNVQSGMEDAKKKISLSRVALASSQGEKKEGIANKLLGVTAQTTAKKEGELSVTGQALAQLESQKANELKNLSYGNLPNMIGAGQGAQGFDFQMTGAQQGVNSNAMSPFERQLAVEQARSMTETTSTKESSGSFMDAFTGLVGTAAAGAGAVMSGGTSMAASKAFDQMGNAFSVFGGRGPDSDR